MRQAAHTPHYCPLHPTHVLVVSFRPTQICFWGLLQITIAPRPLKSCIGPILISLQITIVQHEPHSAVHEVAPVCP